MEKNKKTVIFATLFVIVAIVAIVSLLNWRERRRQPTLEPATPPAVDTAIYDADAEPEDTVRTDETIIDQADTLPDSLSIEEFILSRAGVDTIRIDTNNLVDYFVLEE